MEVFLCFLAFFIYFSRASANFFLGLFFALSQAKPGIPALDARGGETPPRNDGTTTQSAANVCAYPNNTTTPTRGATLPRLYRRDR